MSDINSLITASIPKFTDKYIDKKSVTYYVIELYNNFSKNNWVVEKRYSDFENLHSKINKLFPKFPALPGKTYFGINSNELNQRKTSLEKFIKECLARKDILHCEEFRNFIDLDKNSPEMSVYTPFKVCEYNELPLGIRDFIYLRYDKVCYVACSDMNVASRIDAAITNLNFPWEKKTDSHITVGAVFAFKVKEDKISGALTFEKLWAKSYPTQTGVLSWDSDSNTLAVGLDDGKIFIYKTSSESNYMHYEEICALSSHTDRVMGIGVEAKNGFIYSVSSDKKFYVSEVNQNKVTEICNGSHGFTNLINDKKNQRLFISNQVGVVSVYSTLKYPPELLSSIQCSDKSSIRGFHIDFLKQFIFAGTQNGKICILELGLPGKERFIKEISNFQSNKLVRIVKYNRKRNELITGDSDGKLMVWSVKDGSPVYSWQAHKSEITQLHFEEDVNLLLSGAKDKSVKVWRLPEKWRDEKMEKFEKDELKVLKDSQAMLKIQKIVKNLIDIDSDEDDLNGWDFEK